MRATNLRGMKYSPLLCLVLAVVAGCHNIGIAPPDRNVEVLALQHASAEKVAALVEELQGAEPFSDFELGVDARTNSLLIKGTSREIDEARELIAQLDVPVKPAGTR